MITFFQDIRYAIRILLKNPGFTLIATLSLALGIGANSAIFSLADALLLRPLPILEPSSVLDINTSTPDNPFGGGVSFPNFRDLQAKSHSFEGMVAFQLSTLSVATSPNTVPQVVSGVIASENFFQTLGVRPVLGRGFLPDEGKVPGRDAVAVVSNDFWQTQLARDPFVIGHNLRIKGIDFTIVGVAPENFTGVDQFFHPALYVPAMMTQRLDAAATDPLEVRGNHSYTVKARLQPGVSRQTALAELTAIWSGLKQQFPENNQSLALLAQTELQSRITHSPPDAALVALLMGLVGVVLLIACANVASLLLGRARARTREMALRISLGATRIRLLSQLLTESLLLALVGGAMGLWIAYAGIAFLQTIQIPADPPISFSPRLDVRVLLFSVAAAVLSSVVFGLVPALRSLKTDLVPALKANSAGSTIQGRTIGRNVLVVGQIALSMVLLVAAGMLLDGFRKMLAADPGFAIDRRLMLELDPSLVRYTPQQTRDFYRKLIDQTRGLSGVHSASLARSIPFVPEQFSTSVAPEGYQFPKDRNVDSLFANIIDEHYFDTMSISVTRGRTFTADDKEGSRRVAIVNEEFAKTYWPNQDALGKRLHLNSSTGPWLEIVGVTKTAKYLFPTEPPTKFLFLPFAQNPANQMMLMVETSGDPTPAIAQVRDLVHGIDSNQPVFNVRTVANYFHQRAVAAPLMIAELITTMGLVGLTLALIGLYGLIAYSVSRRTQEIGIRMAIGADKQNVLRMIIRQGLTLSLLGIAVGGVATFAVARILVAGLAGLGSMSPVTFIVVPILLALVTLAACYIPAHRASTVDPMVALRYE
jgi:macrolide transport system ATP-binding/permease protein